VLKKYASLDLVVVLGSDELGAMQKNKIRKKISLHFSKKNPGELTGIFFDQNLIAV
jgi:hypothetical protein